MTDEDKSCCGHLHVALNDVAGSSPYRVMRNDEEVESFNSFLDAVAVRGLSTRTLRTYAYCLLSIGRWLQEVAVPIVELNETHLADYVQHLRQSAKDAVPAPRSINLRLVVARSLYRFHTNQELPRAPCSPLEPIPFLVPSSRIGTCSSRRLGRASLRVKVPKRLVVPLRKEQVLRFFESFRTARDLSIVSLMLFCGLRSREVLSLNVQDVDDRQEEVRVRGKGDKDRVLPLAVYPRKALCNYQRYERPLTQHAALFVNLKGPTRGSPMTPEGLRELFRYHRRRAGVANANPHRFRHTFAVDMIREGMTLPVLMRLMGHTSIEMTMRYVNLSAEDVRQQFERAVRRIIEGLGR